MQFFFSRPGLTDFKATGLSNFSLKPSERFNNKTIPFSHIYISSNSFYQKATQFIQHSEHKDSIESVYEKGKLSIQNDARFPVDLASLKFNSFKDLQNHFSDKSSMHIAISNGSQILKKDKQLALAYFQRFSKLFAPIVIKFHICLEDDAFLRSEDKQNLNIHFHPAYLTVSQFFKIDYYLNAEHLDQLPLVNKLTKTPLTLPKIGVVIPHFGSQEKLNICLSALLEVKGFDARWLYIIDNNSNNRYFTVGVNVGLKQALEDDCDFLWVLNNDTQADPNYIQACLHRFAQNDKIGLVGGKNLVTDKPDRIFWGGSYQAFPTGTHKAGWVSKGSLNKATLESWATFSSVMIRKETMRECGLLDSAMRMIFSDSDYCFHIALQGWQVWYEPKAVILHDTGVSRSAPDKTIRDIFRQDKIAFYRKWSALTDCKEPEDLQNAILKKIGFKPNSKEN